MKTNLSFLKTACVAWLLLALPAALSASQITDNFITATNWGTVIPQVQKSIMC
jgi:hypothetical protein